MISASSVLWVFGLNVLLEVKPQMPQKAEPKKEKEEWGECALNILQASIFKNQ